MPSARYWILSESVLYSMASILYSLELRLATVGIIMNQAEKKQRLTRESWLQQALDILAEDPEHLRIDELAERLGVSKGSFYWHFENRSDFIRAMAEYWRDKYTSDVREEVFAAKDQLREILKETLVDKVSRYDLAVRAWARHEPSINSVIQEVDKIRLQSLREIFSELGFDEADARTRARVFVACHSFEDALSIPLSRKQAQEQIDARHAFFARR